MGEEVTKLKTNEDLLKELAKVRKPTANQVRQQRVSFVYGSLDSTSAITREQVRKELENAA